MSTKDYLPWITKEPLGAIYNDIIDILAKKLDINITYKREAPRFFVKSVSEFNTSISRN